MSAIGLAQLVQDPAQVAELDRSAVVAVLAQLHALEGALVDRLLAVDQERDGEDELLTVEQAARFLKLDEGWLRRRRLPFKITLSGSCVRYSRRGMEAWLRRRTGARA